MTRPTTTVINVLERYCVREVAETSPSRSFQNTAAQHTSLAVVSIILDNEDERLSLGNSEKLRSSSQIQQATIRHNSRVRQIAPDLHEANSSSTRRRSNNSEQFLTCSSTFRFNRRQEEGSFSSRRQPVASHRVSLSSL